MNRKQQLLVAALGLVIAGSAWSQASGLKREMVKKTDSSIPNHEVVVARVEVAPGATAGRHTHAGDEISYVMEGETEVLIDGEPPLKVKAGEAFVIPAGKVHDARNSGSTPVKLIGTYVVEKGKPLATPAAPK
ncbi:cupin domain-containing protein [Oxalobacteraceae bacterium OM1]|nr:cupin domain-containing protein [Oxalobacteraceae bacterium OM1]